LRSGLPFCSHGSPSELGFEGIKLVGSDFQAFGFRVAFDAENDHVGRIMALNPSEWHYVVNL